MKKIYLIIILIFGGCATKEVCKRADLLDLSNESMSFIEGKEFVMGSYSDKFGDKPPKEVLLSNFYIDKAEITNGIYKEYIKANSCNAKKTPYIDDPIYGADELPVVGVTYNEAKKFCEFYKKRLPTEAEWEYSARGGLDNKKFPWGDEESSDFMNYRGSYNSWSVPIMSYPPNSYGLYDMAGNVREWVEDTYEKDFYKYSCLQSPLNLNLTSALTKGLKGIYKSNCYKDPLNSSKGLYRVNRGGSWSYADGYPNSVYFRGFDLPNSRFNDLGFRCAANAEKENWIARKIKNLAEKLR